MTHNSSHLPYFINSIFILPDPEVVNVEVTFVNSFTSSIIVIEKQKART